MARVSSNITPDLLLPGRYNQQNMYNGKEIDPGGGDKYPEDVDRCEVKLYWFRCVVRIYYQIFYFVVKNILRYI